MCANRIHVRRGYCVVGVLLTYSAFLAVTLLFLASTAVADQADMTIACENNSGYGFGDGAYQTTPSGIQAQSVGREKTAMMVWNTWLQNDGATARTFLLKATGGSGSGWTVTYKDSGTNVTSAILGAGYTTPSIGAGGSRAITIEVTPDSSVALGSAKVTRINAYLDGSDPTIDDCVQGTYTVAEVKPDCMIRANDQDVSEYAVDNTYQSTPSGSQVETISADGTVGAWFRIKVQNDGAQTRSYTIRGTGESGSGWTVLYKVGQYDNTSVFLSADRYMTRSLSPGDFEIISVKITPDNTISQGASKDVRVDVYGSPSDTTVRDCVKCTVTATGRKGWYVSSGGSAQGDGSIGSPWDLQTALSHPAAVAAGDTVWLRSGTYGTGGSTRYESALVGTSSAPITVRSYAGEWAVINGGIDELIGGSYCAAAHVVYRDFEIKNTSLTRTTTMDGRTGGINLYGAGDKCIDLIVHDTGHPAIGFWSTVGDGGEINGCVVWGTGIYDSSNNPPTHRGNGIYAQNENGTRYIRDSIFFRNFTDGFKVFTDNGYVNGFYVEGNTAFDTPEATIFVASNAHPVTNLTLTKNSSYRKPGDTAPGVQLGYWNVDMNSATVTDNYMVNRDNSFISFAFYAVRFQNLTFTGNTVLTGGVSNYLVGLEEPSSGGTITVNNNAYYNVGGASQPLQRKPYGGSYTNYSFTNWKSATGYDANSSFSSSNPAANLTIYRRSPYEPGRTAVTIYNWQGASSVTLDLDQCGIEYLDTYEIRDAQNYFATPLVSGTCGATQPTVEMNSLSAVAQPIGNDLEQTFLDRFTHTAPDFGVFVVIRTNTR